MDMNLIEHSQAGFEDVPRELLEKYAEVLGAEFDGRNSDETLRNKLNTQLGNMAMVQAEHYQGAQGDHLLRPAEDPDHPGLNMSIDELFKFNLSGRGKWGGRRRLVRIGKLPEQTRGLRLYFGWSRLGYWIQPNAQVSIPYPVYNTLSKYTMTKDLTQVTRTREDGTQYRRNTFTERPRFQYSDFGDDPETRDFPVSQKQQFREIARRTNEFTTFKNKAGEEEEFDLPRLTMVAERLNIKPFRVRGQGEIEELTATELRRRILNSLGIVHTLERAA